MSDFRRICAVCDKSSQLYNYDAVDRAVNEYIQENILKEFLIKNKVEVIAVSIFEYNKEVEEKKL